MTTTIQLAGDTAVAGVVQWVIAVEQQQGATSNLRPPGAKVQVAPGQFDTDAYPLALVIAQRYNGQHGRVVIRVELDLLTVHVQCLAEVAALV